MNRYSFAPPERRRNPRTQLHMTLHGIRFDPDGGDVRDTLQMLDISRSGMGAITDRSLYPGQKIMLSLPLHPDGGRRSVYASVIRCAKVQEGYRVGLEFDHVVMGAGVAMPPAAMAA